MGKVKALLHDLEYNQTVFVCSECDNTTGDPTRTEIGILCEDCLEHYVPYADEQIEAVIPNFAEYD